MSAKRFTLIVFWLLCVGYLHAQKEKPSQVDTSIVDYDELFDELDNFLDSMLQPGSFLLINTGISSNYFTYGSSNGLSTETKRQLVFTPSIGYYHKSGFGITAASTIVNSKTINPYQFTLGGSYDYLSNRKFATGISFTRFFTKEGLEFYTSPLQNQVYGYFTYRKTFIRPTVAVNYGWGSRTAFTQREEVIRSIRLRPRGYTRVNTTESISDLSLITSVRHDFYWLDVFSKKDFIRFTPQITFISGTQRFGFNQSSNTYGTTRGAGANVLFLSENINLDDQTYFRPVSLTGFLKGEYSMGKFYIQPQMMFDYYFPATTDKFSTFFLVNMGVIL
jgi:hypothetical protein